MTGSASTPQAMNKYVIDYGGGRADFYSEATDPKEVGREFATCANACFGIRKSWDRCEVVKSYNDVELPIPYRGHGATHFLSHHGDDILFDARHECGGYPWKLHNESGHWCSCRARGVPEKSCSVHEHYVPEDETVEAPEPERDPAAELVEALYEALEKTEPFLEYLAQDGHEGALDLLEHVMYTLVKSSAALAKWKERRE